METSITAKNRKYTALAWVLAILVLAVAVPVNLIFDRLNFNLDMTPQKRYSLTKTTEDYLSELDAEGVKVDLYYLDEFENLEKDTTVLDFCETLKNYQKHPCINLIAFDPETDPELGQKLNPNNVYNLKKYDLFLVCNNNVKRIQGGGIYWEEYTTNPDGTTSVVSEQFRAEPLLTGAIQCVVEGIQPVIYFMEGHGEVPMSQYTKLTTNFANFNYGSKPLNLMNADAVPEDACTVIVPGPTADLTEAEYEKLSAYAGNGGNIILMMTPNEKNFSYEYFSRLMSDFCIAMDYNRIYESDSARHKSGDPYTFMCDLVPASADSDPDDNLTGELVGDGSANIDGLICYMPASRSFHSIFGSNYGTCRIDSLIQTQTTAVAEPCGGSVLEDPETVQGQNLTVAMYSKDTLRNNAKLAVFGSAEFITDTAAKEPFFVLPTYLCSAVLTWMYESDTNLMNISSKERSFDTIRIASDSEAKTMIAVYVIFPLLIAAAGVMIWLRRKDA